MWPTLPSTSPDEAGDVSTTTDPDAGVADTNTIDEDDEDDDPDAGVADTKTTDDDDDDGDNMDDTDDGGMSDIFEAELAGCTNPTSPAATLQPLL